MQGAAFVLPARTAYLTAPRMNRGPSLCADTLTSMPRIIFTSQRKNTSTTIGMMHDVTIITASASMKPFKAF